MFWNIVIFSIIFHYGSALKAIILKIAWTMIAHHNFP